MSKRFLWSDMRSTCLDQKDIQGMSHGEKMLFAGSNYFGVYMDVIGEVAERKIGGWI